jgi:DNA recombination protein RmuC
MTAGLLLLAIVVGLAAGVVFGLRLADPASSRGLDSLRALGQLQTDLARLARAQDDLRQDVQRGREASLLQVAETTQGLHREIGQAQRVLAEVKAIEYGRARQMATAAESLKRLEAVVAGSSSRGAAGENILGRALAQLPPDLLAVNLAFGGKVVEYALRLPGGRILPIDSKWTSAASLERWDEADLLERRRLIEQVTRDVRGRIREMAKYLEPERTLGLGLVAVPDGVYGIAPELHADGYREGVLVVPYSMALPYVLALYRLTLRFGASVDADQLAERLRSLDGSLRQLGEEVEGRLSRALVLAQNARDALREHTLAAQRATAKLIQAAEAEGSSERSAAV